MLVSKSDYKIIEDKGIRKVLIELEKFKEIRKKLKNYIPKKQAYFWTQEVQQEIKKSEEDLKTGRYKDYDDIDELLKDLDSGE
jgi:hypothetical protein